MRRSGRASLEYGVQLHLPTYKGMPVHELVKLGKAAEAGGVSQLWVTDNLQGRHIFVVLASLAANLRVKLGTAVMVQYFRNPVDAADALASISELLEGRELTVGIGQGQPITFSLMKVLRPIATLRETAQCLRRLFTGEAVSFGDYPALAAYFNFVPEAVFHLECVPKSVINLYCGGNGPMSLAVGGAYFDGLIVGPMFQSHAGSGRLSSILRTFDQSAERAGRTSPPRRVGEIKLSVSQDRGAAREFVRRGVGSRILSLRRRHGYSDEEMQRLGVAPEAIHQLERASKPGTSGDEFRHLVTDKMIDAVCVAGDAVYCQGRIAELSAMAREYGFEQLMFSELGPDTNEAMRLLCDHILPTL